VTIVIGRAKAEIDCVLCGEPIRPRQECVRAGERTVCMGCHDYIEDLPDHLAGKWWPPLIVRMARRLIQIWP